MLMHSNTTASRLTRFTVVLACLLGALAAQVKLKRGAVVYSGSAANTSAPAVLNEDQVRDATAEWQQIQKDGIDVDSAQGKQLLGKMKSRIREAAKLAALDENRDLVVRSDDIADDLGKQVADVTSQVIQKLAQV